MGWDREHRWKLPPGVSGIVTDLRADLPASWERFVADCALRGVPIFHSKEITESLTGTVEVEHLSENTFGTLPPNSVFFRAKGVVDAIVALIAAPAALMITAAAAIAIKLEDGGPIIFSQPRIGYRGETFMILKLRTMRVDADSGLSLPSPATAGSPRSGNFSESTGSTSCRRSSTSCAANELDWTSPGSRAIGQLVRQQDSLLQLSPHRAPRHNRVGAVPPGQRCRDRWCDREAPLRLLLYQALLAGLDVLILAKTVRIVLTGFGAR